ncbi:MAG: DUF6390 family protein [bacterium]|nr:DUF6390 family protein [bacterium]
MPLQTQSALTLEGIAQCSRYAFGPNRLHYCGPDASSEVAAYIAENQSDQGLSNILQGFQTMYPYLKTIAHQNGIGDPFDPRVVEAYWIGNELLEPIAPKAFYRHLAEDLDLKTKYEPKMFDQLVSKLPQGAKMHHSFHVFNAYKRTGHDAVFHNLESMDSCRVSWGQVTRLEGPKIIMQRKPLVLEGHHLRLGDAEEYALNRRLEEDGTFDEVKSGQWITMHWQQPCEIISDRQTRWLEHFTVKHIALANQTL